MRIQHYLRSALEQASPSMFAHLAAVHPGQQSMHMHTQSKHSSKDLVTDKSRLPYIANQRPRICPLCRASCPDEQSYDTHLRTHFGLRLAISPESIYCVLPREVGGPLPRSRKRSSRRKSAFATRRRRTTWTTAGRANGARGSAAGARRQPQDRGHASTAERSLVSGDLFVEASGPGGPHGP